MNPGVSPARHAERVSRLQEALGRERLGAALVGVGPELEWLVGYAARGFERLNLLVVRPEGHPLLVVPRLEAGAASAAPGVTGASVELVTWQEHEDPVAMVAARLDAGVGAARRLLVSDGLRSAFLLRLQEALPAHPFGPASAVIGPLRRSKDAEEVARLREAARAADRALSGTVGGRLVGRSEADIAREMAERLVDEGHDSALFTIVAAGPGSASPHHEPSGRVLHAGEPLLLDVGGRLSGYCSDITRTVWVAGEAGGAPEAAFVAIHDLVREAQRAGREAVRPGVALGDLDRAARAPIEAAGHGGHFFHRLGHGIGLEVHEEPYVRDGDDDVVRVGDAFSVEPGVYLEGRYGVRIEDIVVCTAGGAETLNEAPRELLVVPGT